MYVYHRIKDDIVPTQVENISRIVGYDDCNGFSIVFQNENGIEMGEMSWDNILKLYHHIKQSDWKDEADKFESQFLNKE